MARLITEANYEVNVNRDDNKNLFIEGIFASAERWNGNNRRYPKSILEREYNKLMESVNNKNCIGELGHPESRSEVSLQHSAILIENMEWEGNDIYGKAKVLSTPMGQITKNLIEDGAKIGVSTRGLGSVSESGEVNEDFTWLTIDVIGNPSNPVSWVKGIYEGKEFSLPKENENNFTYDDIKSLLKEEGYWGDIDPLKIKKLLDEGYTLNMIKDAVDYQREKIINNFLNSIIKV